MADEGGLTEKRRDVKLCRICAIGLFSKTEERLGIHVRCLYEARFTAVTIPSPRYGNRQSDS
jgi:hypothetical protein